MKHNDDYDDGLAWAIIAVLVIFSAVLFAGIVAELSAWEACAHHTLSCSSEPT